MILSHSILAQLVLPVFLVQAPLVDPAQTQDIVLPSDQGRTEQAIETDDELSESSLESIVVEDLLAQARNALNADQYPKAMAAYTIAADRLPRDERLQYNLGVAAYRAGDLETAARAFERSADSNDPALTASSLFNRGNVAYRSALDVVQGAQAEQLEQVRTSRQPDPATLNDPIKALNSAIDHYRDAIGTAPGNRDARLNAELAYRLKKALEEQQQEQQQQDPQQQDQQQQDQEQQDQQQQDQQQQDQQQQDQQQQDQQQQDQQQQDQQQQDQQQQDQQQQDQQQQDQEQQDQQQQDQEQQDQEQSAEQRMQQVKDQIEQQKKKLQQQLDEMKQNESQQSEEQQKKMEQTEQAIEQLDKLQEEFQDQLDQMQDPKQPEQDTEITPQQQAQQQQGQPVRMTKEQAQALLQLIRDKEKERRKELDEREARAAARRYRPVERDW